MTKTLSRGNGRMILPVTQLEKENNNLNFFSHSLS